MRKTIDFVWKAIEKECKKFQKKDSTITFNKDCCKKFDDIFRNYYNDIMARFMKETKELDAHKQAAIIILSCLESSAITHNAEKGSISIAPELIAINVGLSYMNDRLNEKLVKKKLKKIKNYSLPIAIACNTPYIEIMSRLLYYEQNEDDMRFNVLELSDRLFLIEYITLLENGINPCDLKEN